MAKRKNKNNAVECPECGHSFDIGKALHDRIADNIRKDMGQEHDEELAVLKSDFSEAQELLDEFKMKEGDRKNELRKVELETRRKTRDEMNDSFEERVEIETAEKDLEINEMKDTTRQLTKTIEELQQQVTQGSMQAQGEAQELAIEEALRENFPNDVIEEVKKGQKGADIKQTINDPFGKKAGVIVWESKRTKKWSETWVSKIEKDSRKIGGDIAIIVSRHLPDELNNSGKYGNIWVCRHRELVLLAKPLREAILMSHRVAITQEGKQSKMGILYDYLASSQFESAFTSMYVSHVKLMEQIETERRSMNRQWKARERLVEGVLSGATEMIGNIQGITGGDLKVISTLDKIDQANLPAPSNNEEIE
jgi:hypothetical protein